MWVQNATKNLTASDLNWYSCLSLILPDLSSFSCCFNTNPISTLLIGTWLFESLKFNFDNANVEVPERTSFFINFEKNDRRNWSRVSTKNIAIGLSDWNISKNAFKSLAISSKNWIFRGTKMSLWDKQKWS